MGRLGVRWRGGLSRADLPRTIAAIGVHDTSLVGGQAKLSLRRRLCRNYGLFGT